MVTNWVVLILFLNVHFINCNAGNIIHSVYLIFNKNYIIVILYQLSNNTQ